MEKSEMEKFLNELLNLDVKWARMSKQDLEKVVNRFSDPRKTVAIVGANLAKERVKGFIEMFFEEWLKEKESAR